MDTLTALVGLLPARYAALATAVLSSLLFATVHLVPFLPVPAPGAKGFYPVVYAVLNRVAGNYRNAANKDAPHAP